MKNTNQIMFGERLDHLMQLRGFNWEEHGEKARLIREMTNAGCLSFLVNSDPIQQENTARSSMRNHHSYGSVTSVESPYIKAYCDFFGCSADYLYGYIDEVTHEKTDIANETGLSEFAIDSIKGLNHDQTESLNALLESSNFKWALTYLADYKKAISDQCSSLVDFQEGMNSFIKELSEGKPSPEAAAKRKDADDRLQYDRLQCTSLEYKTDTSFREAIKDIRDTITGQQKRHT